MGSELLNVIMVGLLILSFTLNFLTIATHPLKNEISDLQKNWDHGHSEEFHGHSLEKIHGHSEELEHELFKRNSDDTFKEIDALELELNDEIELDATSAERVEMFPDEGTIKAAAEASRVEDEANQALEAQMIADGDQAFQEFDKNINDAIKQNEAVEEEIRKDIVEQSEHRIEES